MKNIFRFGFWLIVLAIVFRSKALAYVTYNYQGYEITNFQSQILLNQNYDLDITEKISVNYTIQKHGIYRVIPYIYSKSGKIIRANLKVLRVVDESGQKVPFTVENYNLNKRIKIGDADKLVNGLKDYFVEYEISEVVLNYGDGPEIYWNVTGNDWEVPIEKASAQVESPYGKIIKTECFGCVSRFNENQANFEGKQGLTIVVQIDKENNLKMPGIFIRISRFLKNYFGYFLALIPLIVMFICWYKKGRDKKYLTENIYYEPENKTEVDVPLFNRPHLPLVYSPIDDLTPAELGTIADEKMDTKDVVAEIVDLARLGYLTITKIQNKGIMGLKTDDYQLDRTEKTDENLDQFDNHLLNNLFAKGKTIKISDLKYEFYTYLAGLRSDMYKNLAERKMTDGDFNTVLFKWAAVAILLNIAVGLTNIFLINVIFSNIMPPTMFTFIISGVVFMLSIFLATKMPRKTAYGYSLHRQAEGLKFYLKEGKWREEIMEKNLFLEEMLPLAIALGVVNKLANDMKELAIEPPSYFHGFTAGTFASDFNSFSTATSSGLASSPSSGWSGGSGFSGGGGGGGFGGGGGGSW